MAQLAHHPSGLRSGDVTTGAADDDLRVFDGGSRLAVSLAEVEARQLGHERVGTEHLLLGLVAEGESRAAVALRAAGVGLGPARHKVEEAVGPNDEAVDLPIEPLPRTPRAARALGRAVRFAHARKADIVGGEDVLLGVLDVEGTAGQVLRGLGVDLDRLRATLLDGGTVLTTKRAASAPPMCPSCSADLGRELTYRPLQARGERTTTRDVVVFSCGACGRFLGITPA